MRSATGKVKCIYIDPPYNTNASPILYKNNYKKSSWLSLMHGRLSMSADLMMDSGLICVAIDDEEMPELKRVLGSVFMKQVGVVVVRSNPAGRKTSERLAPRMILCFTQTEGSIRILRSASVAIPKKYQGISLAILRSGIDDKGKQPNFLSILSAKDRIESGLPEAREPRSAGAARSDENIVGQPKKREELKKWPRDERFKMGRVSEAEAARHID